MHTNTAKQPSLAEADPVIRLPAFISLLFAVLAVALLAAVLLPAWVPGLVQSLLGPDAKVYWYLSRASALVAYAWLWLAMMLGVSINNKMARLWPGGPAAFELHEYASLIGILFALFHGAILLGDAYTGFRPLELVLPFASFRYRPAAVGAGQLSFYVWVIVAGSFYIRRQIGQHAWRLIHFASFLTFAFALIHGVSAGTDSALPWVQGIYWLTGASLLWMLAYRILHARASHSKIQPRTISGA